MPWPRKEPDPLEARRRQLAEQQRHLSEQKKRLTERLNSIPSSAGARRIEPPVWRREEDGPNGRDAEPTPARRRNLARQRQRDMVLFFIFIIVLLIVLGVVIWVAYVRNTIPINGT